MVKKRSIAILHETSFNHFTPSNVNILSVDGAENTAISVFTILSANT